MTRKEKKRKENLKEKNLTMAKIKNKKEIKLQKYLQTVVDEMILCAESLK